MIINMIIRIIIIIIGSQCSNGMFIKCSFCDFIFHISVQYVDWVDVKLTCFILQPLAVYLNIRDDA